MDRMVPWYLNHDPEALGKHISDLEVQKITCLLGLKYMGSTYGEGSKGDIFLFEVLNEQLFFLNRIKFGL